MMTHANMTIFVSEHEDPDDEDSDDDDDVLQESAIQIDLEEYTAVADKNEINEQPRSETTVNP